MKADSAPSPLSFGKILTPEIVVGASFLAVVSLLVVPVPPLALDLLLALSFAISAVVFLTAMFSERPTDFSIFPTLLLISTLLRLSLNIASTRLILLHGHEGPDAAGEIIEAFSQFVVGGNVGVGMVIFLALIVINFVVITKGAGRIAEVAARFTLDAMPGKQMAIDAELSSGAINEKEARTRRAEVEQQADFYGAMDGSNKFIRGDAIAALIITGINLVGGIAIGVIQHGLSAAQVGDQLLDVDHGRRLGVPDAGLGGLDRRWSGHHPGLRQERLRRSGGQPAAQHAPGVGDRRGLPPVHRPAAWAALFPLRGPGRGLVVRRLAPRQRGDCAGGRGGPRGSQRRADDG
jgi:hypothetical protein